MRYSLSLGAFVLLLPASVIAQESDASQPEFTIESYGGADVVPPDIIESDITQDRIEGAIGAVGRVDYRIGETRLYATAGAEVFPVDERYNRYALEGGLSHDLRLSRDGRTRLRLGGSFEHVVGESGRTFDRVRGDLQLIQRHNAEHTTTARLRYGFRNQSEERFRGFDQGELLAELRHNWRPGGGRASVNASLLWLNHDADDDRFSYSGHGFRLIGRVPVSENATVYGRMSFVARDYEEPFSAQFPVAREDERYQVTAGSEIAVSRRFSVFGEMGYVGNPSNIPTRDFSGFIGLVGLRTRF